MTDFLKKIELLSDVDIQEILHASLGILKNGNNEQCQHLNEILQTVSAKLEKEEIGIFLDIICIEKFQNNQNRENLFNSFLALIPRGFSPEGLSFISKLALEKLTQCDDKQNEIKLLKIIQKTGFDKDIIQKMDLQNDCPYYVFGTLYRFGCDFFQTQFNLENSIKLFIKGAAVKNIESIRALALMSHRGEGSLIKINLQEAQHWYRRGIELNDFVSMNNLGLLLLEKELTLESLEQARSLFKRAVEVNPDFIQAMKNYINISEGDPECLRQCEEYKYLIKRKDWLQ